MFIHDVVRQEMLTIYREGDYRITVGDRKANFADTSGRNLFDEGRRCFHNNNLALECFIQQGLHIYILPWLGDQTVNTLSALLFQRGFKAGSFAGVVEVEKTTISEVKQALSSALLEGLSSESRLAESIAEKCLEKYDEYLPETLLSQEYWLRVLNVERVTEWLQGHL